MYNKLKTFLLSVFLLTVCGTSLATNQEPTYLATPVKEQTGMYFVQADYVYNFGGFIPNTGVSVEIVEPPNRLMPGEGPTFKTFFFGTFYDVSGRYFVFSGIHYAGNTVDVTIYRRNLDGSTEVFGSGMITVDDNSTGDAHNIRFFFDFSAGDFRYSGSQTLSGYLVRASDPVINRCRLSLDFSPIDPRDDKPCLRPQQ